MMKKLAILTLSIGALGFTTGAFALESLRGDTDLTAESSKPDKFKVEAVQGGIDRNWKTQPPIIPHPVEKYSIDMRGNGCLKCHSETTHEKEKTKAVPESHYLDRDGNKLDKVSSRRYFCNQCHTPQLNGSPLVENTFGD